MLLESYCDFSVILLKPADLGRREVFEGKRIGWQVCSQNIKFRVGDKVRNRGSEVRNLIEFAQIAKDNILNCSQYDLTHGLLCRCLGRN